MKEKEASSTPEAEWHGEPVFVRLTSGPHLFMDDFLVAESVDLTRTTHQPEGMPEPVLPKCGTDHPVFYMKADHVPKTGLFRMWYNSVQVSGPPPSHHYATSYRYTESEDGINWGERHLVETSSDANFSLFLVDEGPHCSKPTERYKLAQFSRGLWVSFSADGKKFTSYPGDPVIPVSADDTPVDAPDYKNIISDIVDGCWDPLKERYLLGCGVGENGYRGKPRRNFGGRRRCVGVSTSKDFLNWETPRVIVRPDPNNGMEEFYGFKPMVRGGLYIGFLRLLRDDLGADPGNPAEGIGWTELMTSRDGRAWTRYQERFLTPNPAPGTWDHAMAWFGDCIQVGCKEYIYYGGYSAGHKIGDRQVGLGILRKNGFVSRDAGSNRGYLHTPPVIITGNTLTVNADIAGELRVRVTDGHGEPLPGHDWEDANPIHGDSLEHAVRWNAADIAAIRNTPVRLEVALRQAELYGLEVH